MTLWMGIDPGATGALAILDNLGVPITTKSYTDNWKELSDILDSFKEDPSNVIALEKVHGFPGMRVQSVTTLMTNFGGWLSLIVSKELPHVLPSPQVWQKTVIGSFKKGESKPRALEYAKRRWPSLNLLKKHDGIVDALCIAEWARRMSLGIV